MTMPSALIDDEEEIRVVPHARRPCKFPCQFCGESLDFLSADARQLHYEAHFSQPSSSSSRSPQTPQRNKTQRHGQSPRTHSSPSSSSSCSRGLDVFWYPSQSSDPPPQYTPGLILILKRALKSTHAKGTTSRAVLCYERAVHVAVSRDDMGWGCGYRNFLMLCAALADQQSQPLYLPLLDAPIPPGVRHLQKWIENAWAEGFDAEGAGQLKHKLIGSKKWIGTAEIYVAFISRGIPCRLVDFPNVDKGTRAFLNWVRSYFTPTNHTREESCLLEDALRGASPVVMTEKMPLILQHNGHSRLIIGYELDRAGDINLLVFDSSKRPNKELRAAGIALHNGQEPPPQKRGPLLSSNLIQKMLHPRGGSQSRKRRPSNSPERPKGNNAKRVRGGLRAEDPIEIDVEDVPEEALPNKDDVETLSINPSKLVPFFRLNASKIKKNDRYQILYFPMEDPLVDEARYSKRIVTSERVE